MSWAGQLLSSVQAPRHNAVLIAIVKAAHTGGEQMVFAQLAIVIVDTVMSCGVA